MMRKILLLIFIASTVLTVGQTDDLRCYFDQYKRKNKVSIENAEKLIQKEISLRKTKNKTANHAVRIIPVVVHVIHNGGTENISDAQIQSQIDILNEDFRKALGTNGDGNGVDTEIEFCLAKRNPEGRCTNGIVRIQSLLTNHQTYQRTMLKELSFWDNTRYLNVYVVKSINGSSGTLGYSSFPSGPADEDGIVVRHNYFGRIGTASTSLGRTMTHEIGHWFGLYHTFNGGCGNDVCADGDYVCDTPPAASPNFGCSIINSCSIDVPDLNDQIENYMDYSDDNCMSMFTQGQKDRMYATLNSIRTIISSDSNLIFTGCDTNYIQTPCGVVADFTSNSQSICIANQIVFTNKTLNGALSYQWYFLGGTPSTSTLTNPTITYNSLGNFSVKLIAYGSSSTDSIELVDFINVSNPPLGQSLPYFEGFESPVFPTNGINIDNPDGGITWERDTVAVMYSGAAAAKINNLINTNYGQSDAMVLPSFDLTTFAGTPYLFFKWAYAKSDPSYSDELIVLLSKDCGVNWSQIFYRTGTNAVTGPTQTTPYVPDSNTIWKTANVTLASYTSFSNVIIKIVNVTDGGNNLYIDNINIGSNLIGLEELKDEESNYEVFPNPSAGVFNFKFLSNDSKVIQLSIYDMLGKNCYENSFKAKASGWNNEFIQTELVSGIYSLVIQTEKGLINKKLIIR